MLDQHDGGGAFLVNGGQITDERPGACGIQVCGGLVQHEHAWSRRDDTRQRDALLLAAGQRRNPGACPLAEPHLCENLRDARVHLPRRPAAVLQPERDVVLDAIHDELRGRVLEDEPDAPRDVGRRGDGDVEAADRQPTVPGAGTLARNESRESKRERRLSGARRPENEQATACRQLERDVAERVPLPAGVAEANVDGVDCLRVGQTGKPSRTPVRRRDRTSATAAAGRNRAPDTAMKIAISITTSTDVAW